MPKPVFYIAEAPSFSAGEIMLALLILVSVFAVFVFALIVGIKGFHRLGLGRRESVAARSTPLIGGLDILLFLATFHESVLFSVFPLTVHAAAFFVGLSTRPTQPPPPPPTPG